MSLLELSVASAESSLSVRRVSVHEAMSRLFTVSIVARTEDHSLNLEAIVGKPGSFRVVTGHVHAAFGGARLWTGIVNYAEQIQGMPPAPGEKPLSTYFFRLVPGLWLLTQRRGHRIYQHLSIPDILDKLLAEWAIEPTWKVERGSYPKLEYKAQYGENDFAFLSRLCEEAGIAFTFPDDDSNGSKVTFMDKPQANSPRGVSIPYVDNPSQSAEMEFVTNVRLAHEVRPGGYTLRDYDFRNPAFALFGEAPKAPGPEDLYEQYHYRPGSMLVEGGKPGGTPVADDQAVARWEQRYGKERATRSLEADRMGKRGVVFETNCIDLWPGVVVGFEHHPHAELAEKVLVTELTLEHSVGMEWNMHARAVFANDPYRPLPSTPKPSVHGVQSAMVVGPKGQDIHTDEFGRVRVQFPWDREGANDEHSSCWIRVSQGWSGTGFGMINIPRIGQEVLVGFLEGDPDRPLIVGRVYNQTQPVVNKLPDNKTQSDYKSNSSPKSEGYNEIKYEDKATDELVYWQAQKNQRALVKNDDTHTVGHDREKHVGNDEIDTTDHDRFEVTGHDRREETSNDRMTFIRNDRKKLIKNDERERTSQNQELRVGRDQDILGAGNRRERVREDSHLHVMGSRRERIEGSTSLTILENQYEDVKGNHALSAGGEIHLSAMETMIGEAADATIKGPGGFIRIDGAGIHIVGNVVDINVSGSPGDGAGSDPEVPDEPNPPKPEAAEQGEEAQ